MGKKRLALLSVSDKTGIEGLAQGLHQLGFEILSTGGTAKKIVEHGVPVTQIANYTKSPEILNGRVKTLHPLIHGGILGDVRKKNHIQEMAEQGILGIEILVVNLYPFSTTIQKPNCTLENAIENIDIGGPALIRGGAKNWENVFVLTNSGQYHRLLEQLLKTDKESKREFRFNLAKEAFSHTAAYDGMISNYLSLANLDKSQTELPKTRSIQLTKIQDLRYGENPHQKAAFYKESHVKAGGIGNYEQLHGKALSYNNLVDADTAWDCVCSFEGPTCVIVKHANPCGVATSIKATEAYKRAFSTDPTSAFGGIIAFNSKVEQDLAELVTGQFVEVILAPEFSKQALKIIQGKKNLRALAISVAKSSLDYEIKRIGGGLLLQTKDHQMFDMKNSKNPTERKPSNSEEIDLMFAWTVAKYVKSNAIVFCKNGMTLGIGAGQMSRVDSTKIATLKAKDAGLMLDGSVVASDAFFPFPDAVEIIAHAGAKAIIQPGGSLRDPEVIAAADELGLKMVLTGIRHFRH